MTAEQNDDYDYDYNANNDLELVSGGVGGPQGTGGGKQGFFARKWAEMSEGQQKAAGFGLGILMMAMVRGLVRLVLGLGKKSLIILGLGSAAAILFTVLISMPDINAFRDKVWVNNFEVPKAYSQEGSTHAGSWAGVDSTGEVWAFNLNEDGTVTGIQRSTYVEGMPPSADRLEPVGVDAGSVWQSFESIRFAQVVDGVSLMWEIDEVRPSSSDETATSMLLSTAPYSKFGDRQLIVERTTPATTPDGTPASPVIKEVPADSLFGSAWFGNASKPNFENVHLRFDKDGTGFMRTGGMAVNYKVYDFTFTRTDEAGTPNEQGDYVRVNVPDAGEYGSITLSAFSVIGSTFMTLEGTSSSGDAFAMEIGETYGAYAAVPEDTLTNTIWVGETTSGAVAAVKWDGGGVAEIKLKDFGTGTHAATWAVSGSTVTVNVPAPTPADSLVYTGSISPYAESLTLNGKSGDGRSFVMTLRLAEVLTGTE